ncbi:hypothetical protein L228DRAFT_235266 [Xylona heveae TC161]|uniref:Meiotically up-regulated protein Msb1/Mug8 domain-containing protein n=1 Tax=Xylona heveae (strain CBS 132557 / TC161) TaxID=1328760 RepID=A0A165JFB1_XYLHT|nr:hypothetical protein L228DRAFT_235266 [Xylona heveae TC161]KZF26161.1 hypothetical protein L228DRAFT_235266 [Xylona heveae TC161]
MPSILSKVFKSKDGTGAPSRPKKATNGVPPVTPPPKPKWEDAWLRKQVEPEEVQELIRECTNELKARAIDMPFLLLPFRPNTDPSGAKNFIRNYFKSSINKNAPVLRGESLQQELRLTEPIVICSVLKWCWSRIPGGVVTWEAYELFRIGEQDSDWARDAFATFIPLSVDTDARAKIVFDFFDLMAATAAHAKWNGLSGRKLARLAGWWAFEHTDLQEGFDGGYRSWQSAADATSHLFFAYLRSLSPDSVRGINGISALPLSLQNLLETTEYPPQSAPHVQEPIPKLVMIVDSVSPTPFSLLRRARNFEFRDEDEALHQFSEYDDPVQALTEECRRVLRAISSTNQSDISSPKDAISSPDASWSRFEDIGFSGLLDDPKSAGDSERSAISSRHRSPEGLRSAPQSRSHGRGGRPTTPSWADFLSSGFGDEANSRTAVPLLLPPDKILPPIDTSTSSTLNSTRLEEDLYQEPGELASVNKLNLDDSFWWVWMTSLADEETTERKSVFGRCALIETDIAGARWLVIEEKVKGAAPVEEEGAYIVEKKGRFGFTKRGKSAQSKSKSRKASAPTMPEPYNRTNASTPQSRTNIAPDQHARIHAAAAALQQRQRQNGLELTDSRDTRRTRKGDGVSMKTSSIFTLQPLIMSEAADAMKWTNRFDKEALRAAYLGDNYHGRGYSTHVIGRQDGLARVASSTADTVSVWTRKDERDLPALPPEEEDSHAPTETPISSVPAVEPANEGLSKEDSNLPSSLPSSRRESPEKQARAPEAIDPPTKKGSDPNLPVNGALQAPAQSSDTRDTNNSLEKKIRQNKLKKSHHGGGGLKKVFGKKKPEAKDKQTGRTPDTRFPVQSSEQVKLGRRLSALGKHSAGSSPSVATSDAATNEPLERPAEPSPAAEPRANPTDESLVAAPTAATEPELGPVPSQDYQASLSGVDSEETHSNSQERPTANFTEGPLQDVPAFIPDETPASEKEPEYEFVTPSEQGPPQASISEISHEDLSQQASSAQDRWAQIRKNAAERAARQSEDQSRPSNSARTDEDETSGEETIESRVARIKARVAELTGNMDPYEIPRR